MDELDTGKITVSRTVLGKPPVKRTFLVTSETKVEGDLCANARVTVGFIESDEGETAVRIIVRTGTSKKK